MKLPALAFVIQSEALKVAHHGSDDSTTLDFPAAAVISAGEENPYDHPSPQLLERLRQAGVLRLRTDVNGAIHTLTDGNGLEVSSFVGCSEVTAQVNSPKV